MQFPPVAHGHSFGRSRRSTRRRERFEMPISYRWRKLPEKARHLSAQNPGSSALICHSCYYLHPFAGTVTIGPFPLNPMSEIENRSITAPNTSFDRMSVSEIQNHRPAYWTATDVSVGSVFPLWMFTAGV